MKETKPGMDIDTETETEREHKPRDDKEKPKENTITAHFPVLLFVAMKRDKMQRVKRKTPDYLPCPQRNTSRCPIPFSCYDPFTPW